MADEYVKLDDVLKLLNRNSITKAITFSDGISIYDSVQNLPTADVVPRAEAVREVFKAFGVLIPENTTLEEAVESYKKTQKIIRNMAIANAKAEVAREIFEEIEKTVNACVVDESLFKPAYFEFRKFNEQLAELKMKYTGAETEPPKESKR